MNDPSIKMLLICLVATFTFVNAAAMETTATKTTAVVEPSVEERIRQRRETFPIIERARLMVDNELLPQGGLENQDVIDVMRRIPRHRFVQPIHLSIAYRDQAIAIGEAQTISPPYIVAFMTEQLDPKPTDKVLEIGTGSGYQAAVLSLLVDQVYTIEIVEPLGKKAQRLLERLEMDNVHVRVGDGYKGWPEAAPFDSIIVTCSPESIPQPLVDQLREGGRMIIPLGERYQQAFCLCRKVDGNIIKEHLTQTLFVPMTGQAEDQRQVKPDPTNPSILGGDFEETRQDGSPVGWHYARKIEILEYSQNELNQTSSDFGPRGQRFARFVNTQENQTHSDLSTTVIRTESGKTGRRDSKRSKPKSARTGISPTEPQQFAQILQGFAVDGREVKTLLVEYSVRGQDIMPTSHNLQTLTAGLLLFDEDRNQIAEIPIGLSAGSFDWRRIAKHVNIPTNTREAVFLVGIPVATGQLDVDDVSIRKVAIDR